MPSVQITSIGVLYEKKIFGEVTFPVVFELGVNKEPYKKRSNRISTKKNKLEGIRSTADQKNGYIK